MQENPVLKNRILGRREMMKNKKMMKNNKNNKKKYNRTFNQINHLKGSLTDFE